MQGIRPCPYCGGEVEVTKLVKRRDDKKDIYRIQCYICKALVARGWGFPIETISDAEERIQQYKDYMTKIYSPMSSTKIKIGRNQEIRDRRAARASRTSYDDEVFDIHDASQRQGNVAKRGVGDYDV